jgi:deoxyribose-phosphate aldolase
MAATVRQLLWRTVLSPEALAAYIDHTALKPETTCAEVERLCAEALAFGFASVCVNGSHISRVAARLSGSAVKACAVVGFPLGAMTLKAKAFEAEDALRNGAGEIDMVLAIGALKDGDHDAVRADIAAVRKASNGALLKVILETCLLTDDEKRLACALAEEAGADFVKTSTGFSTGGATLADIRLMRGVVGDRLGVKASGGIRTREDALAMIEAGATRIGASAGLAIIGAKPGPSGTY